MSSLPSGSRLALLRSVGLEPFPLRSPRSHSIHKFLALEPKNLGSISAPIVIAGRLQAIKGGAITLRDHSGFCTLMVSESVLVKLEHFLLGDQVAASLQVKGKESWTVKELTFLAANLSGQPTTKPENAQPGGGATLPVVVARSQLMWCLRNFFHRQGFVETETPIMALSPGLEPHIDPFVTQYRAHPAHGGDRRYLLTSPEYAMKRLLVAGIDSCFQVSRVFRNGECGQLHSPEFTMLEWYRKHSDYRQLMVDCEELILEMASSLGLEQNLTWGQLKVDLSPPWPRLTVADALRDYANLQPEQWQTQDSFHESATAIGVEIPPGTPWDEIFFRVMMEKVEPFLGHEKPLFLIDYPPALAALSRIRGDVAERFELYIEGVELANAFTELSDPEAQAERFEEERAQRRDLGVPDFEADPEYLAALSQGLPPTGGIALGIDRLLMLLLNKKCIAEVIAFPFSESEKQ